MKTYGTVREAAIAGLAAAVALSRADHNNEYGGFVYKSGNGYAFTQPKTSGSQEYNSELADLHKLAPGINTDTPRDVVNSSETIRKAGVMAHFHTHPCTGDSVLGSFSAADLTTALTLLGFEHEYLADTCTGFVYESEKPDGRTAAKFLVATIVGAGGYTGAKGIRIGQV